jgi:hypothetical protein
MRQTPSQDERRRGFQGLPGCWALLVLGSTLVLAFEVPLPPPVYSGFCSICSLPWQRYPLAPIRSAVRLGKAARVTYQLQRWQPPAGSLVAL